MLGKTDDMRRNHSRSKSKIDLEADLNKDSDSNRYKSLGNTFHNKTLIFGEF